MEGWAKQDVIEVHPARGTGNAHPPPLSHQAPRAVLRGPLACIIAISEDDHLVHAARHFERGQAAGRQGGPSWFARCLHCGKAGFDTLSHHEHRARLGKTDCATPARSQHHPSRLNGRLTAAIGRKPGPMDRYWARVLSTGDQGDHRRDADTAAMSKGWQISESVRHWQRYTPASEVGRDEGPLCLGRFARDLTHCS